MMLRSLLSVPLLAAALFAQASQPASDPTSLQIGTALISTHRAVAVPRAAAPERDWSAVPALVVLVSIDQLAAWVLEGALPYCGERGFRRLMREGVTFPECRYRHACTETGPGHATLGTGADAARHGIVANDWYDPETGKRIYCCEDLDQTGIGGDGDRRGPRNLLVPTLGDQMKCYLGAESKVVSLSWKDRSAILMAGRSADDVLWFSKRNGSLVTTSAYGAKLPPWAEQFNAQKAADSYFGRVWQRFGPASAYAGLLDDVPYERADFNNAHTLPAVIDGGKPQLEPVFYEHLYESPFANELLLQAATFALRQQRLGGDGPPDLLCISFSSNDVIGHRNGPQSVESRDMTLRVDEVLGQLLEMLDREVGAARYAIVVSADHGVQPMPELARTRRVPAGRGMLTKWAASAVEAALVRDLGVPEAGVKTWILVSGEGLIYLQREAITKLGKDLRKVRKIAALAAAKVRGVAQVCTLDELVDQDQSADPVVAALRRGCHPERSPDLVVVPQPLWIDGTLPASHGTPWPADRHVPLLVKGPRILRGEVVRERVSPGVGVVILAELLGIPRPPGAEDGLPGVVEGGR